MVISTPTILLIRPLAVSCGVQPTSVLAPYADVLLLARCESCNFYNSYVAPMLTAEFLCACLSRMTNGANRDILKRIDEYTSQVGFY